MSLPEHPSELLQYIRTSAPANETVVIHPNGEPTQSYTCNPESAMASEITGYSVLESSPHPAYAACVGMSSTYFLPLAQPWFVVAEIVSPVDEVNVAAPTPHLDPELGECSVKA